MEDQVWALAAEILPTESKFSVPEDRTESDYKKTGKKVSQMDRKKVSAESDQWKMGRNQTE